MSSDQDSTTLKKGEWARQPPNAVRSPCPMLNSLANHGYIPRDGRSIRLDELKVALISAGRISPALAALLANPTFLERREPSAPRPSLLSRIFAVLRNPWALMQQAALRDKGQVDSAGKPVINLDQIGRHGVVEHDVSLTRLDFAQGDDMKVQPRLLELLLKSSTDGGKSITVEELVAYRARRLAQQKQDNPSLKYGSDENDVASGEVAFLINLLGDGKRVECARLKAFLGEERLPREEGWTGGRQGSGSYGLISFFLDMGKVKKLIGSF